MIVMLCTRSRGGMRAVVEAYRQAGLFDRWDVRLLDTHDEGTLPHRLALAFRAMVALLRLLAGGEVTLVHVHFAMRGSFWRKNLFATAARLFGVPVIGHLHGSDFDRFHAEQPPWRKRLINTLLARLDAVLVLGEGWRKFVSGVAPAANVLVLPNAVRMPQAQAMHQSRSEVRLLFLGLVGQRKGVFELLQALGEARTQGARLHLTIGGNGEIERAREAARRAGVDDIVDFVGWVDGPAKLALLAQADMYVLPSHNEGLPVSILEAMSWGLPVISTDVGAIAEAVRHEVDGFIVSPGDVGALAQCLVKLGASQALRQQMGRAARERAEQCFSEDVVLPRLEQLYARIHLRRQAQRA